MLTVPEAAVTTHRNPETIRRWIRSGRLRSTRVGTQYLIDEKDLEALVDDQDTLPVPEWLGKLPDGRKQPRWVRMVRDARRSH